MLKNIFRFIIALVGGLILGNLLAIPIGAIIDLICGHIVTGSNMPISFPNIIYIISVGFLSGFVAGIIYKKRGMLLGGVLIVLQLLTIIGISMDVEKVFKELNYSILWYCIELLPCIFGGYVGERFGREKIGILKKYVGAGIMGVAWIGAAILGLVIHVWTIIIAAQLSGLFEAVLTFIFPVLSEIYWFFKVGSNFGYGSYYSVAIMAYIGLIIVTLLGAKIAEVE
jgi:hypothetical protein